ncbi:hypothetical protein SK224_08380 [Microbacterium sp. BG28]|uniref:hypothetical protein n=1 Tax=Microbacterium sp. BG28 TaxID=3097356 RepID=UPI002A5A3956|nr:hypothetical protein [Microbacterium sp. BG28]MDY0829141.1 hypothetical protein [Microbacterium sp. BG28]
MGDPKPGREGVEWLVDKLAELELAITAQSRASGTQMYQSVQKLERLIDDIQGQIDEWATTRYTNAQVEARIAAGIAAAFAGNVSITGSLTVNGALAAASLSTAGSLTAGGVVTLPGARGTSLVSASGRVTAWIGGDGRLGHTS